MDLIATLLNTFVVVAVGVVLTYVTNDRFKALRGEMAEFRSEIAGIGREMSDLRTDIKADIARVEARLDAGIASLRSDIVQIALAVGAGKAEAQ